MGSAFNPHILIDKLSKLNSSQQSIETLSHWCIFHMNKAKQVVETWDRQFHCAPREQRLAFLYLANDIIQNSRRKGAEFVAEFWKVLPNSLRDMIENGDEFGKNAALRLINIWEERKVFGSRGQILKDEFVKRQLDNNNRNLKYPGSKPQSPDAPDQLCKQPSPVGNELEKLASGYQALYRSQLDEEAIFKKCRNAVGYIEKVGKDIEVEYGLGHVDSGIRDELKGQNSLLRDCIEQLTVVESSRANLVSLLREALQDEVFKLEQVREQLQAAQTCSEQAVTICSQLLDSNGNGPPQDPIPANHIPPNFTTPFPAKTDDTKSAAAAVAAKLAASTSSAQMLTFVLSSLASEGVIGNSNSNNNNNNNNTNNNNPIIKDNPLGEYQLEKRARLDDEHLSYVPQQSMPPVEVDADGKPPPPSSSSSSPPYSVPQYMQTAIPVTYGYGQLQVPMVQPGYAPVGPPIASAYVPTTNSYQSYQAPESGLYGQPPSMPMSRQ